MNRKPPMGMAPLAIGAALAWWWLIRPWHLRWGATDEEVQRAAPGVDIVAHPGLVATRAIPTNAPASAIWPWLVQMGFQRAGWYSYDWLDNEGRRVERILPEFQRLAVGDTLLTDARAGFRVEAVEPERALTLSIRGAAAVRVPGLARAAVWAAPRWRRFHHDAQDAARREGAGRAGRAG